jgi:MEMO1 family protein
MGAVRPAAVAGAFYPGDPRELDATVQYHLSHATADDGPVPKAIIAPHAGYIYSGPIAASAYVRLRPARDIIRRVVLLGPCHRVAVQGLALSDADAFATPLGDVPLDKEAAAGILDLPQVQVFDASHQAEHSLEVHLPFLQVVLDDFTLVPLVVGDATPDAVAEVLERLWGGPETLIVISSDLSHYLDYETARRTDSATCEAIENLDPAPIGRDQACGRTPVGGLLALARRRGLRVETLDVRNSGDTAGSKDRVVGYGAWMFLEDPKAAVTPSEKDEESTFGEATKRLLKEHGESLLRLAAASIEHGIAHGEPAPIRLAEHPPALQEDGACFVTLYRAGRLRGCIGSSRAHRPLAVDVDVNAFAAAFRDPRFKPLTADEKDGLALSISVLSAPEPMTFADRRAFFAQLRPGIDGLIIEDQGKRGLFLPSVWETLPSPQAFVRRLRVKAGLAANHWSDTFKAWRFVAEEMAADELDDPLSIWAGGE